MTLLDAPKFDEVRERRNRMILFGSVGSVFALIVLWWLVAGRPLDFPWNWNASLFGRFTINRFFDALEKNDLQTAYGVWIHNKNWQQHPDPNGYTFARFQKDWSPTGAQNDYGAIHSHRIAAAHMEGNVLLVGIFVNDKNKDAINLDYDPKDHTLNFSPEDVRFLEGPGGIH
jgi:hypothetical protein